MAALSDESAEFIGIPNIPEFYRGKTILLTGGTGFLGKLIIEKLLYSCPDLKQIYVFIRDKKNVLPEKRLAAMYNNSCFERLRRERDGLFQTKVKAIAGNMLDSNLGLSENDRVLVTTTIDIVIHSAASVRFDDHLRDAFEINVMATLRLMELAKQMCNLKCYVHISTSFCNIKFGEAIEEKIYPPRADCRTIREICDNEDLIHTINTLTPKLQAHDDIPVYHACAGADFLISLEYIRDVGLEVAPIVLFENTFRPMNVIFFNSLHLFRLYVLMSHVLPAVAADIVFRVLGKKPMEVIVDRVITLTLYACALWWILRRAVTSYVM